MAQNAMNYAVAGIKMMPQLFARNSATIAKRLDEVVVQCGSDNDYNGRMGVRISAIFVILVGSTFGAVFPVFARQNKSVRMSEWGFFIAKYFGSGVIVATAFIHLLAPANEALTDPCLTGPITDYDWVEGIALMTIFALFFVELMAMRYATFGDNDHELSHSHGHALSRGQNTSSSENVNDDLSKYTDQNQPGSSQIPGEDHLSHSREHTDNDQEAQHTGSRYVEDFAAKMTAIFILEFGVIFHSIFVGLTLAVAGTEFNTLYVVLIFHQTFEGLGLGSRLAEISWPRSKKWTPYIMAASYGLSTPIAIAIGLGVRTSYMPGSQTALVVNGVFDSISAGILIYTGLVELMAHEFMFSEYMRRAPISKVLSAFGLMCLGAGLMALLGKWA